MEVKRPLLHVFQSTHVEYANDAYSYALYHSILGAPGEMIFDVLLANFPRTLANWSTVSKIKNIIKFSCVILVGQ